VRSKEFSERAIFGSSIFSASELGSLGSLGRLQVMVPRFAKLIIMTYYD
jgi:hypothetical protein